MQWGRANGTSATTNITFPTSFMIECKAVTVNTIRNSSGANGFNYVSSISTTGATVILDSPYDCYWVALGY